MTESTSKSYFETALRRFRERNAVGAVGEGPQGPRATGREVDRAPVAEQPVSEVSAPRNYKMSTFDPAVMEQAGVVLSVTDESAIRAYKILRTRLQRRMSANHWNSVGVTGAGESVGKTLTAINLAIALAQDGRTPVCLVDLDLHRPQVGTYLGMVFDKGLTEYLHGEATPAEVTYSTSLAGLLVVPNGRPLQHASELLGSPKMADLVRFLEAERPQRTIIYDLPPLLLSDDVLMFSPHMDCVLDVVAVGGTSRANLERSKEILAELNVAGVVLNRATEQDHAGKYYTY